MSDGWYTSDKSVVTPVTPAHTCTCVPYHPQANGHVEHFVLEIQNKQLTFMGGTRVQNVNPTPNFAGQNQTIDNMNLRYSTLYVLLGIFTKGSLKQVTESTLRHYTPERSFLLKFYNSCKRSTAFYDRKWHYSKVIISPASLRRHVFLSYTSRKF